MSIKTNELQQITAPQGSDSLLLDTAAAGTGRLALAQAAAFFGAELVKQTNSVGAALSQKADAKKPTVYQFHAAEGFTVLGGGYFKTQENIVTVFASIKKIEGVIGDWSVLGTMPEGFRSVDNWYSTAACYKLEPDQDAMFQGMAPIVYVRTNGTVTVRRGIPSNVNYVQLNLTYIADH